MCIRDRIKLSPGETVVMTDVANEVPPENRREGVEISFDYRESRHVTGLAKKGLVIKHKSTMELTELGAMWLRSRVVAEEGAG